MRIVVSKLKQAEHSGDWHDAPLNWKVTGPDGEVQKFSTAREADLYKRIRSKADCQQIAIRRFVDAPETFRAIRRDTPAKCEKCNTLTRWEVHTMGRLARWCGC